jgi:GWxTD domain-containing protein
MMQKALLSFVFILTICGFSFSQAGKLKAYIDQKTYYAPNSGTYVELQYQFVGYTLHYDTVGAALQSKVAVAALITSLTGDTVARDIYVLQSPLMRDSIIEDFFDIQRIPLKPGIYKAHIELQDLLSQNESLTGLIDIEVPEIDKQIAMSDILIAEVATPSTADSPFNKSGYEIIPRISNFYGQGLNNLPYYIELYNTNTHTDSIFGFKQRVVSSEKNEEVAGFSRFIKMKPSEVIPVLRNLDISKLPSGSYRLEVELVDRNNLIICKATNYYFERVNELETSLDVAEIILDPSFQASITDDSLKFYIGSLIPIARPAEARMILDILKTSVTENYRKYIQQFWIQTSGTNAVSAWNSYKSQVLMVQELYGNNFQDGYETDRGRVYLQYGPPNSIVQRETSPTEYPYEIWHYYKIKKYSNKRFIFYNPDLVNNAYRLLHSDMIGELQNYKWQMALVKRNTQDGNVDNTNGGSTYGGNSEYYYRQY